MSSNSSFIQVLLHNTDAGYIVVDHNMKIKLWSPWIERRADIPMENVIGRSLMSVFPQLHDSLLEQTINTCIENCTADTHPKQIDPHPLPLYNDAADRVNDARLYQQIAVKPVISDEGTSILFQIIDITEAFLREMKLHEQTDIMEQLMTEISTRESQVRTILDNTLDGIITMDEKGIITQFNIAAENIFGYTSQEILNDCICKLILANGEQCKDNAFMERFSEAFGQTSEMLAVRKDGTRFMLEISLNEMDLHGERHYVGSMRDITERTQAEKMIRHMAQHDALTDLPNRVLFRERLQEALANADRRDEMVAVMFLDLDRFKTINDTLGHHTGDALLCEVSNRLKAATRNTDTVARLGGDEFAIIQTGLRKTDGIKILANKIIETVGLPYNTDIHEINTSTSIGITVHPTDADDPDQLLQNADMAMYRAKRLGRNNFQFYSIEMHDEIQKTVLMEKEIRRAIRESEFVLHYQPQLNLQSSAVIGAEALVRWQHPERGMIPPNDFIPCAEDSGLIVPIGTWVLRESCQWARTWHDRGVMLRVAVNLSAEQFTDPNLIDVVRGALRDSGIDARYLELEITESLLMDNASSTISTLYRLAQLGCDIAIDDFGTGYSSLAYLKRFPVNKIKIDRSFVQELSTNKDDAVIVQTVISLGHSLGLKVIAEGLETEEQLGYLQFHECDEVQGYFTGKPMPADLFNEYMKQPKHLEPPVLSIRSVRRAQRAN